ncbi:transcriptional regulator, GntR family [Paracoccus denitrificans]|uniref:Transcriptional regulator, GntR family n=3 Tax=Paracoccaceae TaxID=31989 RepID=A1B7Z7_PARDP|nr:transcriptional regulator, GntR family [Paracoccus denitrificans PD1222]SDJ71033.1 transcriptional regulator, GntR family [Paracoccus denitrificans]SFR21455.1 transcriptional regulator, GntR family [Paracoccus denitrificans]
MGPLSMTELSNPRPPMKTASLTGQVYDAIAEMLLDGTLKPDSRTSIRELSEYLGVSAMPVREAIGRLVAQGALAIQRNKAVVVPPMTPEDLRDLVRTRVLLECEAARLAVDRIPDSAILRIRELHEQFSRELSANNRAAALTLNRRLHFTLYDAAESPSLRNLIAMSWLRAGPMISLDLGPHNAIERASHSVDAHAHLVAALQSRDREAAAKAIELDITTAAGIILEHLAHARESRT